LNLVSDFALSAKLKVRGGGQLALDVNDGRQTLRVTLVLPEGKVSLATNGQLVHTAVLSAESRGELARGAVLLELSNFDRHLLLAIGSRVELSHPLTDASPPLGTTRPLAVGAAGLQVTLGELTVYRDIYYSRQAVGEVYDAESAGLRLGSGEYYLLGDNSPISLDSRGWGGVSARLLLGRPLGVR
jgi:signal peptidase I